VTIYLYNYTLLEIPNMWEDGRLPTGLPRRDKDELYNRAKCDIFPKNLAVVDILWSVIPSRYPLRLVPRLRKPGRGCHENGPKPGQRCRVAISPSPEAWVARSRAVGNAAERPSVRLPEHDLPTVYRKPLNWASRPDVALAIGSQIGFLLVGDGVESRLHGRPSPPKPGQTSLWKPTEDM
jgi:hypothetical protein